MKITIELTDGEGAGTFAQIMQLERTIDGGSHHAWELGETLGKMICAMMLTQERRWEVAEAMCGAIIESNSLSNTDFFQMVSSLRSEWFPECTPS